jgi:hypothetical protein
MGAGLDDEEKQSILLECTNAVPVCSLAYTDARARNSVDQESKPFQANALQTPVSGLLLASKYAHFRD